MAAEPPRRAPGRVEVNDGETIGSVTGVSCVCLARGMGIGAHEARATSRPEVEMVAEPTRPSTWIVASASNVSLSKPDLMALAVLGASEGGLKASLGMASRGGSGHALFRGGRAALRDPRPGHAMPWTPGIDVECFLVFGQKGYIVGGLARLRRTGRRTCVVCWMKLKSSTMKESRLSPSPSRQALASRRELQRKLSNVPKWLGRVVFCGLCAYRPPIVDWAQAPPP